MTPRLRARVALGLLAALSLAACGGVRERLRASTPPASAAFRPAELVDVLTPDRIPSIDHPTFETPALARAWLDADEPVVVLEVAGEARAYPLAILTWHEVVNDVVDGRPIAVTYDPLTNAAVVFDRTIAGKATTLGVSGKLYRSSLVLFDRPTKSLWPQLSGRAEQGPLKGATLTKRASQLTSIGEFAAAYPTGQVLARAAGHTYGFNPYAGYDSRAEPFDGFFAIRPDRRLPRMSRVAGVVVGSEARAYPFDALKDAVAQERVGQLDVVVFWQAGTGSALDTPTISQGRDVGSAGVYSTVLDGTRLDFERSGVSFRDRQTGSTWSVLGRATAGPLKGKALARIEHVEAFWFAWAAFHPATTVWNRT